MDYIRYLYWNVQFDIPSHSYTPQSDIAIQLIYSPVSIWIDNEMYKRVRIDSTEFEILLHQLCYLNNLSNGNYIRQIFLFFNLAERVNIICPTMSAKCNIGFPKFTPHYDFFSTFPQIIWTTNLQSGTTLWIIQWCEHVVITF
jgi:hypothetical protein